MSWMQLGGSLVAILALAGFARWLRLGESRIDSADTARRMAEEQLAGFVAGATLIGENGAGALVAGNGALALLKRHGAHVAARRLVPPLRFREAIEGVAVDSGDRRFGWVILSGVLPDDVERLAAIPTSV